MLDESNNTILQIDPENQQIDIPKKEKIIKMWMILVTISILGIILNLGLLMRRKFLSSRTSSTTRSSLFLLGTMAAADTLCLFSLLFIICFRFFSLENHPLFLTFVCKLTVFVMHTTSSFSIWCWLVLSAVRYMAIYRPYTHLKLSKEPRLAVIVVAFFCCISEMWVLWDIEYDSTYKACGSPETELNRHLQIFEIIISYFLPVIFITILDLRVIVCRTSWISHRNSKKRKNLKKFENTLNVTMEDSSEKLSTYSSISDIRISKNRVFNDNGNQSKSKRRQQLRVLRRCLCITFFDLSMNLPSYLLRLYLSIDSNIQLIDPSTYIFIEEISQVMYFAQFALNALYLFCIIYDAPRKKFNASSTQLSVTGLTPRASRKSMNFRETQN